MKKALIVAHTVSFIDQFCMDNVKILNKNYQVFVISNFKYSSAISDERIEEIKNNLKDMKVKYFHIDFKRNPLSIKNFIAYKYLKQIIKQNEFELIHCHTPVGGVLTRLANRKANLNNKLIYTAHGFHFHRNSSKLDWIIYYPIELFLSRYTNLLLTINQQDFKIAQKFKCTVKYVPGVGIDYRKNNFQRDDKQKDKFSKIHLLSVGELNENKNHIVVIKAVKELLKKGYDIEYYIYGKGKLLIDLKKYIEKIGLKNNIILKGYNKNLDNAYMNADIFILPSYREGLSVALMEAMSFHLPVLVSNIRGNEDLIKNGEGGYLFDPNNEKELSQLIESLIINSSDRKKMGSNNFNNLEKYSKNNINKLMNKIYLDILNN